MNGWDRQAGVMREILHSNVVVGPALAHVGISVLDKRACDLVTKHAALLTNEICKNGTIALSTYPGLWFPASVVQRALIETYTSTALNWSMTHTGRLRMDESTLLSADERIRSAVRDYGSDSILVLSLLVVAYRNYQLLHHYDRVAESDFVSGKLHRPGVSYPLDLELTFHLLTGTVKMVNSRDNRYVTLTSLGRQRYAQARDFLQETGFLKRSEVLGQLLHFSSLDDYDDMVANQSNISDARLTVLRESGIKPGMRVLELGCGTGELTLTSGLYQLVGQNGYVVATDPSVAMLARAKDKLDKFRVDNVDFVQSSAEQLPFDDNSFDAVVGCCFLHFADIPKVLGEVHRVSKPGAKFTTLYGLHYSGRETFFREWFGPLSLMASPSMGLRSAPDETTVARSIARFPYDSVRVEDYRLLKYYQNPEQVVRFVAEVTNGFEDKMVDLPWRARDDMLDTLVNRGRAVLRKYGHNRLVETLPGQFLQARVLKDVDWIPSFATPSNQSVDQPCGTHT